MCKHRRVKAGADGVIHGPPTVRRRYDCTMTLTDIGEESLIQFRFDRMTLPLQCYCYKKGVFQDCNYLKIQTENEERRICNYSKTKFYLYLPKTENVYITFVSSAYQAKDGFILSYEGRL